ncbi:hypothetical protein F5879DRAFT_979893 [Lentinula edodes]|nr:hypothetical protein F5879DRAFT_979893 [Lentinula edodes]
MEFLNDLTQDLHTAQDAWNEEAARRTESMAVLCHSTKKERRALLQLASDVEKLLGYVDSFASTYREKFASFRSAETRIVEGITQNANILNELFVRSAQILQDQLQQDPLTRTALVDQLAANTNYLNEFLKPKIKEIRIQTFIFNTRCRLKTLASSLDMEPPEQQPVTIDNHQVLAPPPSSCPSSFRHPLTMSTITQTAGYSLETQYQNRDPSIEFEYTAETPVEDLLPLFLATKKQELNMVLNVVENFRIDGQRIATQVKEANENLQCRRESHRERLDVLHDYADNMVEQVEHKLKVLKKQFSTKVTASRYFLEFGQAHTTEYLDALWSTAIQVMSSHVPKDSGNVKSQVMAELRRLDYTVASHCEDFAVHSSFISILSANYPDLGDALLSGDIPLANEEADNRFAPDTNSCFGIVSNVSENEAVFSSSESSRLLAVELVNTQVTSTGDVPQPILLLCTDEGNGAVQVEMMGRENPCTNSEIGGGTDHRRYTMVYLNETVTTLISKLVADIMYSWKTFISTRSLDSALEIAADSWYASAFRIDTVYYWTTLVEDLPPVMNVASKLFASIRYFNNAAFRWPALICHFIGNGLVHINDVRRQQWPLLRAALVVLITQTGLSSLAHFLKETFNLLKGLRSFLLKHSKLIFLLSLGIFVVVWLKVLTDRLILEVSHKYLSSEFRQILRHDEDRRLIRKYWKRRNS